MRFALLSLSVYLGAPPGVAHGGVPCPDGPTPAGFAEVCAVDPAILYDIRYATPDNFTGKIIYDAPRCLLRRTVARRLALAQRRLRRKGLGLKVWDCYRPLSVQKRFWEILPDERYVANPTVGSKHNRGAAVDVTLVDTSGRELEMPTTYDDFSERAHRDYKGPKVGVAARRNMGVLEAAMVAEGFEPLPTEWWHFDSKDWRRYDIK